MEVSSVISQYYHVRKTDNIAASASKPSVAASPNTEQSAQAPAAKISTRQNMLDKIEKGSMDEAEAALRSIGSAPMAGPVINLRDIIAAQKAGSTDVVSRISRVTEKFRVENEKFHKQELEIIRQGRAEGKNAKEILRDITNLLDQQSDLFKLSISWNGDRLSDPDQYSKLVEMTPEYLDAYA